MKGQLNYTGTIYEIIELDYMSFRCVILNENHLMFLIEGHLLDMT